MSSEQMHAVVCLTPMVPNVDERTITLFDCYADAVAWCYEQLVHSPAGREYRSEQVRSVYGKSVTEMAAAIVWMQSRLGAYDLFHIYPVNDERQSSRSTRRACEDCGEKSEVKLYAAYPARLCQACATVRG